MRALAFLLLLSLFQSPTFAPIRQEARKKLSDSNVPFTPDAFIQSVIADDKEKVEWFLKAGMNPDAAYEGEKYFRVGNKVISNGDPALIVALILEHEEIVSLLLSHGADVNKPGSYPSPPLMLAKGDLVKTLLDKGADVNWRRNMGYTVLMNAAADGDLEKVKMLLEHGADINAKNERGETAAQVAVSAGQRAVFALLRERGADISDLPERSLKVFLTDPDPNDRIMGLIQRLRRVMTKDPGTGALTIMSPSLEDQQQVPGELLKIAGESAESRAQVIDRMIDVVYDLSAKEEYPLATAWMRAVDILGELRATEAVDVLVNNLDHTGQTGIIMSIHIHPPRKALVRIGEPAVPRLVEALAHPNRRIRTEAAWVLYSIDRGRAKEAVEAAAEKETDDEIKQSFKFVLNRIKQGY